MTEQKRSGCLETGSGLAGFALVVVLMLGASFQASAQPCLPGLVDDSATPTAAPFRGGVVYVDASGSMDGFVAPKNDAAFVNLLYSLKGAFEALVPTVDYFRFGSKIEKINDHEFLEARKKAFFHTSINGLSRISDAVHEINKAPSDRVGVVLTDLFLNDGDNPNALNAPLREEMATALRNGRSVGILGLRVPFDGVLTDLATITSSVPFHGARERVVFLLVIGLRANLELFYQELRSRLADGQNSLQRFTLFTADMVDGPAVLPLPILFDRLRLGGSVRPSANLVSAALEIPSYTIGREGGTIDLQLDPADQAVSKLAAHTLKIEAALYFDQRSAPDNCPAWSDPDDVSAQVKLDPGDGCAADPATGRHCLRFEPDPMWLRSLPRRLTFVLALKVITEPVDAPDRWFAEWGYPAEREPVLLEALQKKPSANSGPSFFPTLNLDRLGAVLHELARDRFQKQLTKQPKPLQAFLAFQKD